MYVVGKYYQMITMELFKYIRINGEGGNIFLQFLILALKLHKFTCNT